MAKRLDFRLMAGVAKRWAKIDGWVERARNAGQNLLGGFLSEALDVEEQSAIGPLVYDARDTVHEGLFDWEETWLAARLPPAPALVLVGAAGGGREAVVLAQRGYHVTAFDPREEGSTRCRTRLGEGATVVTTSYEALARAVLDGERNEASPIAALRFDAVLLGWGSFGHVLDARERERLLDALVRVCPEGPILASFPLAKADGREGRMERGGRWVGRRLGALRSVGPHQPRRLFYGSHYGFVAMLSRDEITALGRRVGRETLWGSGAYPHVTWPAPTRGPTRAPDA